MNFIFAFLEILTASLPTAVVDQPYTPDPLVILGGGVCSRNEVTVRAVSGPLPDGVTLSAGGYLRGTPNQVGTYTFQVRAANSCQVATRTLTLRVDGAPILVAAPDDLAFHYTQGGPLPAAQVVRVSSNWNGMAYSIEAENAPWLVLRPLRGSTPLPGSAFTGDPVKVSVDPSKLAPGTYQGNLTVTGWEVVGNLTIPVVLVVEAKK